MLSNRYRVETHLRPENLSDVSSRSAVWELTLQPQWTPYVQRTLTLKTVLWFAQRAHCRSCTISVHTAIITQNRIYLKPL